MARAVVHRCRVYPKSEYLVRRSAAADLRGSRQKARAPQDDGRGFEYFGSTASSLIDIAPPQQIIHAADAVPAVAVGFDHHVVLAVRAGATVVLRQEVDQQVAVLRLALQADREGDLVRLGVEVV